MTANRFYDPFTQKFNASTGSVGAGWKLYFYQGGSTTTLQDTYADTALATPNTNPVVADGDGLFGDIFLDSSLSYAVKLTDESDVQVDYADYIQQSVSTSISRMQREVQLGSQASGQVFTLTEFTYAIGDTQNLLVFQNGNLLEPGVTKDYEETNSTSITVNAAITINPGDKWTFLRNVASGTVSEASNVTYTPAGTGAVDTNLQAKLREKVSVKDFGAVGDGVSDDTAAFTNSANNTYVEVPDGTYLINSMPTSGTRDWIGLGTVTINLNDPSTDVLVPLKSNSRYENIDFNSTIADRNSQRAAIDDEGDVYVHRCSFNDFLNPTNSNGWGVLIQRSSRITLDQCSFSNNTQSDIALTDQCYNINIFNPKNTTDSGVYLNVEPNSGIGVRGMNVVGGHFRQIDLLENDNTVYSSQGIVITGAKIDVLRYDGSGVNLIGCEIGSIVPEPASLTNIFAGQLMCDTINCGKNLLDDPYLFDVSPTDTNCYWTTTFTGSIGHRRVNSSTDGKYYSINPDNENQSVITSIRNNIAVTAGENLMVFMRSRMNNAGTGTNQVNNIVIQWFNSGASLIQISEIKTNRGPVNEAGEWQNDVAIIQAPTGAVNMKFRITNTYSSTYTGNLDVAAVGLFRFSLLDDSSELGDMPQVIGKLSQKVFEKDFYRASLFNTINQTYPGCFVGERIIDSTPTVGSPFAWTCTALPSGDGFSGTFTPEGTTLVYDTTNVSNPPTDAELDAIFGTPAAVGAGFSFILDDAGGDANVYCVHSTGNSWWYSTLTKAT